jgi:hypothetical protein
MHPATVDLNAVYREVAGVSERAGAIVIVAFIEDSLEKAILSRLRPLGKTESLKLTEGAQAPLNTLYAKIQFGYSLYIFGAAARDDLLILKDIRNRFAHRIHTQDFADKEVVKLCKKLHFTSYCASVSNVPENSEARDQFHGAAHYIMNALLGMAWGAQGTPRIAEITTSLDYPTRPQPKLPEASRKKVRVRQSRRTSSPDQM